MNTVAMCMVGGMAVVAGLHLFRTAGRWAALAVFVSAAIAYAYS